jgi:putative mycofactocin binding protein MftB
MRLAKHVRFREEKFGAVLFDTLREKVFVTNRQGRDILKHLLDGKSQEETVEALLQTYSAPREQIAGNVSSFVSQLLEKNLLEAG